MSGDPERPGVVVVGSTAAGQVGSQDALADIATARAGMLAIAAEGETVRVTSPCYLDGLTRQAFLSAVMEVSKARRQVDRILVPAQAAEAPAAEPAATVPPVVAAAGTFQPVAPEQVMAQPATAAPVAAAPVAAAPVTPTPVPTPMPMPTPTPVPTPMPPTVDPAVLAAMPAVWRRTHTTAPGARAWSAPNPALPPLMDLASGTELRVLERLGDWARVDASNGWSGWVDARLLVSAP